MTVPACDPEQVRTLKRPELERLQLERLQRTLESAYTKVPAYRAKFDAAGVRPQDLRSLADLARFPFTTKQDLRDSYPFALFAAPREKLARVHASSGSADDSPLRR